MADSESVETTDLREIEGLLMSKRKWPPILPLALALVVLPGAGAARAAGPGLQETDYRTLVERLDPEAARRDVQFLAGLGSRVTGTPGADQAAD